MDKSKDDIAKTRITAHMNKDHQDSLRRYLQHYCKLSFTNAASAQLEDINFTHLIITSSAGRNFIPLEPPLQAWSEARTRLVSMDAESLKGLGLSSVVVKDYKAPTGFPLFVFLLCATVFALYSRASNFIPGSMVFEVLQLHKAPGFARFSYTIQPWVILGMDVIHGAEALWMAKKLYRHQVILFSQVWWKWMLTTFVEGITCHKRFDHLVRVQQEKSEHKGK